MELETSRRVGPDTYLDLPVPWGGAETIEGRGRWNGGQGMVNWLSMLLLGRSIHCLLQVFTQTECSIRVGLVSSLLQLWCPENASSVNILSGMLG